MKNNYWTGTTATANRMMLYNIKKFLIPKDLIKRKNEQFLYLKFQQRLDWFKDCHKVLDIACGNGELMIQNKLNKSNMKICGVEYDKSCIDNINKLGFECKYSDLNTSINYKDNTFDGACMYHILEHFFEPKVIMSECKRVLKDKGIVVVSVPAFSFKHFHDDYTHRKFYSKVSLFRIFNDYEYIDIKVYNGIAYSFIGRSLFMFPRLRFQVEKLIGKFKPHEYTLIAKNMKERI